MKMLLQRLITLCLCFFVSSSALFSTGASVDESPVTHVRYVDVANTSGNEDGSSANPWNTLAEGFDWLNANGSLNAKLIIANGLYREGSLSLSGRSGIAVIEGESRGGVIISGSDVWTGWTADGNNWHKPWTNDWGLGSIDYPGDPETELGRRLEMVFQDGILLRQVLTLAEMADGTYYVDEVADRLYVRPFAAADPAAVTLEVSVRPHLFFMYANDDVVFRNLTFQHAASGKDSGVSARTFFIGGAQDDGGDLEDPDFNGQPINSPPDRDFAENILIEDCIFQWNNGGGASINNAKYVTLLNTTFQHNGSSGLGASRLRHSEYVNSQFNYNNWRKGIHGGLYGWAPAGTKTLFADDLIIRGCDFIGNHTTGLWLDFGSTNVTVFDSLMTHNWSQGFYNEANYGPINASALLVRNNGYWPNDDGVSGGGIHFAESRAFSVSNSYIIDNSYYGLGYRNSNRTSTAYWSASTHSEADTYGGISREMNFFNNTVVASRSENRSNWTNEAQKNGNAIALDSGGTSQWSTDSVPTYSGDFNTYYSPHTTTVFTDKQDSSYGWDEVDLAGWRTDTGQDINSTWNPNWQDGLDFDAYQESDGLVVFEAENFHANEKGTDAEPWQINHGLWSGGKLGHNGSGYLEPPANASVGGGTEEARLSYRVYIHTPGTYYLAVRRLAQTTLNDSVHVFINGNPVGDSSNLLWGVVDRWTWKHANVALGFLDTGIHTLEIVRREEGFAIDRIALADDPAKLPAEGATVIGPDSSASGRPAQSDNAVTVTSQATVVKETKGPAVFRFARQGIDGDLTVNFSLGGNAVAGVDYVAPVGNSVVIPDGSTFANLTVNFLDDGIAEAAKTLSISVVAGAGYTAGSPNSASVTQPANGLLAFTEAGITQPTGTTQSFILEIHNPFAEAVTYSFVDPATVPDEYGWIPESYQWTNIASSGNAITELDNHDGTGTAQINNLPNGYFRFMGGSSYNRAFISSNGLLTFFFNQTFSGFNIPLPSQDITERAIAGFWDDLDTVASGRIYQASSGDRHIFQFDNVNVKGAGTVTFQIVLDYNDNLTSDDDEVVIIYKDVSTAGTSHTIGAQSWLSVNAGAYFAFGGALHAYNEARVTDNSAIRLVKMPAWFTANHGGTPLTIPAGETAMLTFTLDTTGLPTGTIVNREFAIIPDRSDIENTPLKIQLTVGEGAGALAFTDAEVTVQEDAGTATLSVTRAAGATGAVSIDYTTKDGTALDGVNYTATSGTLTWANGESGAKSIVIPLIDVPAIEPIKTFGIRLSNPQGGILLPSPRLATVIIEDAAENTPPVITWQAPTETLTIESLSTALFFNGVVNDDGIPHPLTLTWEQISGPGTATFDDPTVAATSATFSAEGEYVLRLTANDGALTDSVEITVNAGTPDLLVPTSGLHVHYPFDASSGTSVSDISGNGFNTSVSNVTPTWSAGKLNNACFLPGSNFAFIDGPSMAVNDANGLTAAAWVRLSSTPSSEYILAEHRGNARTWLAVDSSRRLISRISNATTQTASGALTVGQWHHVAVTAGNGSIKLYIDGVQRATRSAAVETNSAILRLANGNSISSTTAWNGGIDEFRTYTRPLTAHEVGILAGTAVFNGNLAPVPAAGSPQSVVAGGSITLAGSATDDGLPNPPAGLSYTWEQVSGPATAVFVNSSDPTTSVTLPAKGDYRFRLVASDGDAASAAYVTHTASGEPADLTASHSGPQAATLTWTDSTGETGYRVWLRAEGASEWSLIDDSLSANTTSYVIDNLTRGASYEFSIEALDGSTPRDSSEVALTLREGFIQESTSPHLVVMEAENYTTTSSNGSADSWLPTTDFAGYSGETALQVGPDNGHNWSTGNIPATAPVLSYQIDFATAGTHYVFVRCREPDIDGNAGDSLHVGINDVLPTSGENIARAGDANGYTIGASWVWAGKLSDSSRATITVPSPGVHTVHIWAREDGLIVDKLILSTDINYFPDGTETDTPGNPITLSPVEQWRQTHFGITTDTGNAADLADPDNDGFNNLLEFAFGSDPWTSNDTVAPVIKLSSGDPAYLEFEFRRRVGAGSGTTESGYTVDGITYTVEVSTDLSPGSWQTGAALFQQIEPPIYNGDGTETMTVRLLEVLNGSDSRFIRLRVTSP